MSATHIAAFVEFIADIVTILVGGVGLWGLIFKRKQISAFFRVLTSHYISHRVQNAKSTLAKLEHLDYQEKSHRPEINALVSQVCGQLKSLTKEFPALSEAYNELLAYAEGGPRMTEPRKRRLVHELVDALDEITFNTHSEALE